MKKRKKVLALLLTMAMLISLCSTTVFAVPGEMSDSENAAVTAEPDDESIVTEKPDDENAATEKLDSGKADAIAEADGEIIDAEAEDGIVDTVDELMAAIEEAKGQGHNYVDYEGTSIDKNLTIPSEFSVGTENLTVPEGLTITVKAGAGLDLRGNVEVKGSILVREGGWVTVYLPGTQSGLEKISLEDRSGLTFQTTVSSENELQDAFSQSGKYTALGQYNVMLGADITLTENIEIPVNTNLDVYENLTVSAGKTITNNGLIFVGNGTLKFEDNAVYAGNGMISVQKEGRDYITDGIIGGDFSSYYSQEDEVNWYITSEPMGGNGGENSVINNFEELEKALQGETRYIEYTGSSIEKNLIIPSGFQVFAPDVEILQDVELTVSAGATFESENIRINGSILIKEDGFVFIHVSDTSTGLENITKEADWGLDFRKSVSSEAEFIKALDESKTYSKLGHYEIVMEDNDITLTQDVVIPVDVSIHIDNDTNLIAAPGIRVTNWGGIWIGNGTISFGEGTDYIAYGFIEVPKAFHDNVEHAVKGLDLTTYRVDQDPEGISWVIVGHDVGDGGNVVDFERLKTVLEGEPCGIIYTGGPITENLTIPAGFDVHCTDLQVPQGVIITVEEGGILSTEDIRVAGTIKVHDDAYVNVHLSEIQVGLDKIVKVGENSHLLFNGPASTEAQLKKALAKSQYYTSMGELNIWLNDDFVLTDDIVIPEKVLLAINNKLTVPSGKKITNNGHLLVTSGLLVFGDKTGYAGDGVFEVNRTTTDASRNDPFEAVTGLDPADFEVGKSMYDGWILKLRTAYDVIKDEMEAILEDSENMTAGEILDAVQKLDKDKLEEALTADNSGELSDIIVKLEEKVDTDIVIKVTNKVPAIEEKKVSMVGAGLNTPVDGEKDITLIIDKPEKQQVIDEKYDSDAAVRFSMKLDNVQMEDGKLAVPVKITLPVPESINPKALVILHYEEKGGYEEIKPFVYEEKGQYFASFVVTHFSDFIMTTEAKPVHEHTWDAGTVTKEPTDKEEGEKTYTCTGCGETKVESIPKLENGKDDTDKDDTDKDDTDKDDTDKDNTDKDNTDKDNTNKGTAEGPETGDSTNMILWFSLLMISVVGIVIIVRKKSR